MITRRCDRCGDEIKGGTPYTQVQQKPFGQGWSPEKDLCPRCTTLLEHWLQPSAEVTG